MTTDYRDQGGVIRTLGRRAPDAESKKLRAARTNIQAYRTSNGLPPLVPSSEWVPHDNRAVFGNSFVTNQQSCGGCVGWSAGEAHSKLHYLTTGELLTFSGAYIYAHVNGGQDNGATITDAMVALEQFGVCLQSQFDYPHIYLNQIPAEANATAPLYKSCFDMTVSTWAEVMTAVQMGLMVQLPIQVGNNFEQFDQYGAAGFSNGYGNHSIHVDGAIKLPNGAWALTMMNSWGLWGPQKDGRCLLYQSHVDGCDTPDDAFAHGSSNINALPALV